MHAEDLIVDEGSDWHAVENILELLPDADGVATLALIIEAVDTIDLTALVIASQKEEVLLKLDLVCQEQDDSLEGVLSTVDVVTKEEVICLWREASVLEESQQVRELSVSVT